MVTVSSGPFVAVWRMDRRVPIGVTFRVAAGRGVALVVNARLAVAGAGTGATDRAEPITFLEWRRRGDEMRRGQEGYSCQGQTFFLLLERQTGGVIRRRDLREGGSGESAPRTCTTDRPFPWAMRSSCHGSPVSGEIRSPALVWRWNMGHIWVDDRHISGESVDSEDDGCGSRILSRTTFRLLFDVVEVRYMERERKRGGAHRQGMQVLRSGMI